MPRRTADPSLSMVSMRLRRADVERAKAIARREGVPYQCWLRDRMSQATREAGALRVYKFKADGYAAAVVIAQDRQEAETIARDYATQLQASGGSPIAMRWLAVAEVREVPYTPGVAVWAEAGGTMMRGGR